jgi:hypothetical protein
MALADAGIPVALIEKDRAALDRGLRIIADSYANRPARTHRRRDRGRTPGTDRR